jgi:hypothetical protein
MIEFATHIKFIFKKFVYSWLTADSFQQTTVLSILRKTPLSRGAGGVLKQRVL